MSDNPCGELRKAWETAVLFRTGLSDGSRDPGRMVSQGPGTVFDTNSSKTGTIVLRNPRYAVRLAGIGTRRAPKKPLLAPFGATISGRIGLYYAGHGKTPLFRPRICKSDRRVPSWVVQQLDGGVLPFFWGGVPPTRVHEWGELV